MGTGAITQYIDVAQVVFSQNKNNRINFRMIQVVVLFKLGE